MELEFLGGAGTVTGSKCLVHTSGAQILLDCGLFEGFKHLRRRNRSRLAFEVTDLDAVVLTHAHLDHSGYVPSLVAQGYRGPVYASPGTIALCGILWPDSGRLHEEDARYAARMGFSKHDPPLPLYTEHDADVALGSLVALDVDRPRSLGGETEARIDTAGHILGASLVRLNDEQGSVLFSGDVGRPDDLVMPPPSSRLSGDALVLESTYGDRRHPDQDPVSALGEIVRRTVERSGTVLIPAFAVGRTQAVLVALDRLRRAGEIPPVPIFLDSPMAIAATKAYLQHRAEHRLGPDELDALESTARLLPTVDDSKSLNRFRGPCVIISAAGMLTGGRVLHHLARLAPDPRTTIVLVGYQAAGTRGASLLAGERSLKVHGARVPVRCNVERIDTLSAHADQDELVAWVRSLDPMPSTVFVNHGEPEAAEALRRQLTDELGLACEVATDGLRVALAPRPRPPVPPPIPDLRDERGARLERILSSPSYVRADRDLDLLASDELRADRLMLEFLKIDLTLRREGIDALVAVFGSARIHDPGGDSMRGAGNGDPEWTRFYAEAREFGRLVGSEPYDGSQRALLITGGGPGIMEAANRGAFDAGARSIGLNIALEHEQIPNSYVTPELTFQLRYFGIRKMHFLARAVALVAFPGGFGTADEVYETLTLVQTRIMTPIPIVLVGRDYWERVLPLDFLAANGLIDATDRDLVTIVDSGAAAWAAIRTHHERERPTGHGPVPDG
jgi:metallo-beta-lactamase family protein